ncbi:hypothetical protein [Cohnella fermenti]|uniref:Uncharacterized protein n=1 Tax=Cohnella fermenti TaxID=2565925 RepID=A0A4S4BSL5_9BACL|nr:hypothetical protein [Cohnella fermenti]THF78041.1 hypothetical protein E6C55_15195 [Cohnella fermenti]
MAQFAAVLRELKGWLSSFSIVRLLVPYSVHLMLGGLAVLFLEDIMWEAATYKNYDTIDLLFNTIPLHALAYYGFYCGIWLALVSAGIKYLPYALWGYAFLALFPFHGLVLMNFIQTVLYAAAGALLFQFVASSSSGASSKGASA